MSCRENFVQNKSCPRTQLHEILIKQPIQHEVNEFCSKLESLILKRLISTNQQAERRHHI